MQGNPYQNYPQQNYPAPPPNQSQQPQASYQQSMSPRPGYPQQQYAASMMGPQPGFGGPQPGNPQQAYGMMNGMGAMGQYFQGYAQPNPYTAQPNPYAAQPRINYRQQNWNGYQLGQYKISPQFIEQYAPGIFQYFDKDRSGSLEMDEVPVMINHLFRYLKMPPPTYHDCLFLMFNFDRDGNGKMDLGEFKTMLYYLAGRR